MNRDVSDKIGLNEYEYEYDRVIHSNFIWHITLDHFINIRPHAQFQRVYFRRNYKTNCIISKGKNSFRK